MVGEQKLCAAVYAGTFAINLALCFILIPRIGPMGAAAATAAAMVTKSVLLFVLARKRLGLHVFIWHPRKRLSALAQQAADHFAGRGHRHFVDEGDLARIFVRRQPRAHESLDVARERVGRRDSRA